MSRFCRLHVNRVFYFSPHLNKDQPPCPARPEGSDEDDACSAKPSFVTVNFPDGEVGMWPIEIRVRLPAEINKQQKKKKTCNLIMCMCAVPGSTACCIYTATRLRPPAPTHKLKMCCATCRWAHHRIRQNVEVPSSSYITTVVMEDGGKPRDLARLGSALRLRPRAPDSAALLFVVTPHSLQYSS